MEPRFVGHAFQSGSDLRQHLFHFVALGKDRRNIEHRSVDRVVKRFFIDVVAPDIYRARFLRAKLLQSVYQVAQIGVAYGLHKLIQALRVF